MSDKESDEKVEKREKTPLCKVCGGRLEKISDNGVIQTWKCSQHDFTIWIARKNLPGLGF